MNYEKFYKKGHLKGSITYEGFEIISFWYTGRAAMDPLGFVDTLGRG